jgi:hypothetical protein
MSKILFYASLGLSLASFAMFCWLAAMAVQARAADRMSRALKDLGISPKDLGGLATAFNTAGPIATAATLSVFFMIVALASGNVITLSVEAAANAAP